ncbi:Cytochrome c oxidase subunit 6 [Rhodotorula mucilaginosa]|uniref:Cytochrome c oxidase subunit 6, mitochondrial n=1 Tax=Rhodotorula mucilaginosa TaxID=5537 RepID=A0A9P6W8X4_RHOMI|nr:Cytochrome c oxidase subunit 6 [Rhodotorula mucilaginosa]
MQAIRAAARPLTLSAARTAAVPRVAAVRFAHSAAESYDDFNARYADFFANTQDLFELQRGLNNCFAYDLVPSQRESCPDGSPRASDLETSRVQPLLPWGRTNRGKTWSPTPRWIVVVIEEALRAARRVNDFSTAVRVFEGLKEKTENAQQYKQYVDELAPLRKELGIALREELYGSSK